MRSLGREGEECRADEGSVPPLGSPATHARMLAARERRPRATDGGRIGAPRGLRLVERHTVLGVLRQVPLPHRRRIAPRRGEGVAALLPSGVTMLGAPEGAAMLLVAAVSLETGLPVTVVRKQAKEYGTKAQVEGDLTPGASGRVDRRRLHDRASGATSGGDPARRPAPRSGRSCSRSIEGAPTISGRPGTRCERWRSCGRRTRRPKRQPDSARSARRGDARGSGSRACGGSGAPPSSGARPRATCRRRPGAGSPVR